MTVRILRSGQTIGVVEYVQRHGRVLACRSDVSLDEAARSRPEQAQYLSSLSDRASVSSASAGVGGGSFAYVGQPTIPEGMSCAEWRRRFPAHPKLGVLAHIRVWLRWHQFKEAVR